MGEDRNPQDGPTTPQTDKIPGNRLQHEQQRWDYSQPLQYKPLYDLFGYRWIRLLILHPGIGNTKLRISLAVVNLADVSRYYSEEPYYERHYYEALSYVWGSSEKPHKIQCNLLGYIGRYHRLGTKFTHLPMAVDSGFIETTDNLHDALLGLRLSNEPRCLWIDSICIDQSNSRERSEQIQLMYQIYSKARGVIIWHGKTNDTTDLAFDCLDQFADLSLAVRFDCECSEDPEVLRRKLDPSQWNALFDLLSNQWFTRLWVFQESVSNFSTTFQQGHRKINWREFGDACEVVSTLRNILILSPGKLYSHLPRRTTENQDRHHEIDLRRQIVSTPFQTSLWSRLPRSLISLQA